MTGPLPGLRPFTNEWMSWIDEGIIKAVQPHNPAHPQGMEVQRVDCSTYTVTPGLIDCHGHVTLWGVGDENLDRMNSPEAPFWAERILYRTLVHGGVTTLRDVGGATQVLKRLVEQGVLLGLACSWPFVCCRRLGDMPIFEGRIAVVGSCLGSGLLVPDVLPASWMDPGNVESG